MTEARSCAVGPCNRPRFAGTAFCDRHGPNGDPRVGNTLDTADSAALASFHPAERIACPHCQTRGHVRTASVKLKRGISGGKATGAVVTGGFSVLLTGLSRKVKATQATCGNCRVTWEI